MKYESVKLLNDTNFRRLTGVHEQTFSKMCGIVSDELAIKRAKGGRPNKLCIEDMILMTLEYLREYRTYFHISKSYGLSESNTYKTIRFVEGTLIAHFPLPSRRALYGDEIEIATILIDATECPIQRPKKTKAILLRKKETSHNENADYCGTINGYGNLYSFL